MLGRASHMHCPPLSEATFTLTRGQYLFIFITSNVHSLVNLSFYYIFNLFELSFVDHLCLKSFPH